VNLYLECSVCSRPVDVSVPRDFCPFCNTPAARKLGEVVRQGACVGAVAVCQAVTPAPSHELPVTYPGALDLYIRAPHEHIHSTSTVARIGDLTKPITNVTTIPTTIAGTVGTYSWGGTKGTITASTTVSS
jgi:hypothetical protein